MTSDDWDFYRNSTKSCVWVVSGPMNTWTLLLHNTTLQGGLVLRSSKTFYALSKFCFRLCLNIQCFVALSHVCSFASITNMLAKVGFFLLDEKNLIETKKLLYEIWSWSFAWDELSRNLKPQRCWLSKPGFVAISLKSGPKSKFWTIFLLCASFCEYVCQHGNLNMYSQVGHIITEMVTTLPSQW